MTVGTRSILFSVHNIVIHPLVVGIAWWKLFGFPPDPRLWIAFLVHDLGYIGKSSVEGPIGETHVELGAHIMEALFGASWGDFCRGHSRYHATFAGPPNLPAVCGRQARIRTDAGMAVSSFGARERRAYGIHGAVQRAPGWERILHIIRECPP